MRRTYKSRDGDTAVWTQVRYRDCAATVRKHFTVSVWFTLTHAEFVFIKDIVFTGKPSAAS